MWWPCDELQRRKDFVTLITWLMEMDAKLDAILERERDDDDD